MITDKPLYTRTLTLWFWINKVCFVLFTWPNIPLIRHNILHYDIPSVCVAGGSAITAQTGSGTASVNTAGSGWHDSHPGRKNQSWAFKLWSTGSSHLLSRSNEWIRYNLYCRDNYLVHVCRVLVQVGEVTLPGLVPLVTRPAPLRGAGIHSFVPDQHDDTHDTSRCTYTYSTDTHQMCMLNTNAQHEYIFVCVFR